jgi:DNA uptake protein ComE-like DNA-binding protein
MRTRNSLNNFLNKFNNYSRNDRNAVIFLVFLIFTAILVKHAIELFYPDPKYDISRYEQFVEKQENAILPGKKLNLFYFDPNTISETAIDSLDIPPFVKNNIISYREAGGKFQTPADLRKIYGLTDSIYNKIESFIHINREAEIRNSKPVELTKSKVGCFDPNTADSATLGNWGFNTFQTKNLIKYREQGGNFTKPADILKIYGIDSIFFSTIRDHIQIQETIAYDIKIEEKPELIIELNQADSIDLIRIKGIGPVFAKRILSYRDLLGGYHSVNQLSEVYNFPHEALKENETKFRINPGLIKKIRINFAEYSELLRHPYLNKNDVKTIVTYRNKNGSFNKVEDLYHTALLDSLTFFKIKPYLSCE